MTGLAKDAETRLDKWLFHARFYRTRLLAQAAAANGKVRLNGTRVGKPSQSVRPGDVLTLGRGGQILAVRILGLAQRRSPAGGAQALYEIITDESLDKPASRP
jgi:ribosome-associated heat shock protein Hsp15